MSERKIVGYDIAFNDTPLELYKFVNSLIQESWQPIGGIATLMKPTGPMFYQAMVKYEEPDSTNDLLPGESFEERELNEG